ncbi:MAG: hypothetical protein OXJ53_14000 [Gammaproteobacteria bacterium]|nr:hypothetical protein [Gammaproteobacteria bacterium]MDE0269737.1 hypothetical protein [Gammaproteobacteria bacterium]
MAVLEPRLLPLIEILVELGLDWLAVELVEGLQRGEEPIDDRKASEQYASSSGGGTLLQGVDQLQWAAQYVDKRLRSALDQTSHSLDALDQIAAADAIELVLRTDEQKDTVDRAGLDHARAQLSRLSEALEAWVRSAASDFDQ